MARPICEGDRYGLAGTSVKTGASQAKAAETPKVETSASSFQLEKDTGSKPATSVYRWRGPFGLTRFIPCLPK